MNRLKTDSLQWSVGIFLVLIGALALTAPQQFNFISAELFSDYFLTGLLALGFGVALLIVGITVQTRTFTVWLFWLAALFILALAWLFFGSGAWITAINILALGAGMAFGAQAVHLAQFDQPQAKTHLLSITLAGSSILTALALLTGWIKPAETPFFATTVQLRYIYGWSFLAAGVWLALSLFHIPSLERLFGRFHRFVYPAASILTGLVYIVFWIQNARPERAWVSATFFLFFGAMLVFLPLMDLSRVVFHRTSLRARLALILALTATIPLILTIALISRGEENITRLQLLEQQEFRAASLANNIADFVHLHQAALQSLSRQPELMQLPSDRLAQLLAILTQSYPDVSSFSVYGQDGELVSSTDPDERAEFTAGVEKNDPLFQTGEPAIELEFSEAIHIPVFKLYQPVVDGQGRRQGVVSLNLSSTHITQLILQNSHSLGGQIYLTSDNGRAIVHPNAEYVNQLADLSDEPAMQKIFSRKGDQGFFESEGQPGKILIGYARVPDLNWLVVVEYPADQGLLGLYAARNAVFGFLLLFLAIAILAGYFMAGWLTVPLRRLLDAVSGLTFADESIPLPSSDIFEIRRLVVAFSQLRRQLKQRTAERERALAALVGTNENLEARVRDRTREIEEYTQKLEQSNKELEEFAFIASHDLQEPLRKIQNFGDLLVSKHASGLPEEAQDYVSRMQNAAERMSRMIDALLSYSRISTRPSELAPVSLAEVAHEVVGDLEASIQASGGSVEIGDLPVIEADHSQMYHLLLNLIGNGLKFRRKATPPRVVITCRAEPNGFIVLTVSDNGVGFDPQLSGQLFQLFHRLHGRSEFPGTGIGLAVCRKIVERHGGSISVSSQPGEGTTFTILLPTVQ